MRKHKFVDPGKEKAEGKIQELRAKAKSFDNEEKNAKYLPELKKLKDSLSTVLKESLAVSEVSFNDFFYFETIFLRSSRVSLFLSILLI